jgi:hypothetical protein
MFIFVIKHQEISLKKKKKIYLFKLYNWFLEIPPLLRSHYEKKCY